MRPSSIITIGIIWIAAQCPLQSLGQVAPPPATALLAVFSSALSDDATSGETSGSTSGETSGVEPFAKGRWNVQVLGSTVVGDNAHGEMGAASVGFGYHLLDNISVNVQALGGLVNSKVDDDGAVAGFDVLLRWHFFHERPISLYVDAGAGFQLADTNFPSDSHQNFRLLIGTGATVELCPHAHLIGGVRYIHISNANTSTINSGLDGPQLYLGLLFPI